MTTNGISYTSRPTPQHIITIRGVGIGFVP